MSLNLVLAQVILLMLGLIGISTAEPNMIPDHASKIVVALLVTFALSRLRPKAFLSMGTVVWVVTLILLALVLVIGVGTELSPGTKRWLRIPGFQFQPSEFAKLGLILQIASFFARRGVQHKLLSATLMIGLSTLLVLLEPDLGSTVLIFSLGIVLMYAAGVKMNNIGGLLLGIFLIALPFGSLYLERHPYILRAPRVTSGTTCSRASRRSAWRTATWGTAACGGRGRTGCGTRTSRTTRTPSRPRWASRPGCSA